MRIARKRLLVTGVGGAPALDLSRRLLELGHQVIATDANPLAAGLLLPGVIARTTPRADDPEFSTALLALCRDLRPDAILSGVEQELPHLHTLRTALADLGVRTWLPAMSAIDACVDKARFASVLREHRIPTPRTFVPDRIDEVPDAGPLVVKPRRGQGSQNVHHCATRAQAKVLCELVADPVIQERIAGREFTADCLVDRDGRASLILRYRLVVKGGLSFVSRTFQDDEVAQQVTATLAAVGAGGACCVQGFIRDGDAPWVVMTEINARFAGGFLLSEAAGADLVEQTLNGLFDLPVEHGRLGYKSGITLAKYAATLAVGELPISTA